MKIKKLNESYFICYDCSQSDLAVIQSRLKVFKDALVYLSKSKYEFFNKDDCYRHFWLPYKENFIIPYQAKDVLYDIIENYSEYNVTYNDETIKKLFSQIQSLQPFETYTFQKKAIIGGLINKKHFIQACTGSGKSLIISLIIKILIDKGLKGLLLVPNISLVNQFDNDITSYNLDIDRRLIGGDFKVKKYDRDLTISTWQSARLFKESLKGLDFIIVDEAHSIGGKEVFDIVNNCTNAEYKIGLSGTIPDTDESLLSLLVSFGFPKPYVRARDLIDAKLGTDIRINHIELNYTYEDEILITKNQEYAKQLKYLLENRKRLNFICNLSRSLSGNTVVLFDRIKYGLDLFYGVCKMRNIETVQTSYKDFKFQDKHKIYFINGLIKPHQRELIRQRVQEEENAIIIANQKIMGTGINIPNLHNLIFATPIKAFITVTQSLGRLIRVHNSKNFANVYDIDDRLGFFKHQFSKRLEKSYQPEGYNIKDVKVDLSKSAIT